MASSVSKRAYTAPTYTVTAVQSINATLSKNLSRATGRIPRGQQPGTKEPKLGAIV